ncbi:MFS transporter [Nonomuraea sp. NPDC059007]|uniref:MFS transporter n=1 Tax=Nonomuraea sp. NPDC059007 TaxID=3346692 RepID=UPI00367CD810
MAQYSASIRRLLVSGLVDYLGAGLFLAFSAVYFTQLVGLTIAQVGLGMGAAGCVAMAGATPLGRLADRVGVRRMLVALHLVRAGGTAAYAVVGEFWGFLAAVTAVTVADQSIAALTQAFVAELAGEERRGRVMAAYRTIANIGISVGGPLGGLLTGASGRSAFQVILLVNAAAYLLTGLLVRTIGRRGAPATAPGPSPVRRSRALRERRLLAFAGIDTLLQLWLPVLNLGFPLWLIADGQVPRAWIGPLYAINTVLGVALMVPSARFTASVKAARRCQVAGAVALAAACLAFWASWFPVAIVVLTFGEIAVVAAAWTLSYALAPGERRAEYLAAFGMGRSFGRYVLGPLLVTGLLQALGGLTWAILAALFCAAALATLLPGDPGT